MIGNSFNSRSCGQLTTFLGECSIALQWTLEYHCFYFILLVLLWICMEHMEPLLFMAGDGTCADLKISPLLRPKMRFLHCIPFWFLSLYLDRPSVIYNYHSFVQISSSGFNGLAWYEPSTCPEWAFHQWSTGKIKRGNWPARSRWKNSWPTPSPICLSPYCRPHT